MRDLRKIKSKYEFKLDNKQIAFLLIGALVVLVVVFALGVVVGKGLVQIQNIEAGLDLKNQVADSLPNVPDLEIEVADAPEATVAPTPDEEGFVNILKSTPTPEPVGDPGSATPPSAPNTPAPTPPPGPPAGGNYTIQLSSHPGKAEAESARAKYMAQGLSDVYLVSFNNSGQTWYRVRTGAYATKAAATQFAEAIKAKGIVASPWVTKK